MQDHWSYQRNKKHVHFTKYCTSGHQFVDSNFSGITNVFMTTSRLNTGKQERRVAAADEENAADAIT